MGRGIIVLERDNLWKRIGFALTQRQLNRLLHGHGRHIPAQAVMQSHWVRQNARATDKQNLRRGCDVEGLESSTLMKSFEKWGEAGRS